MTWFSISVPLIICFNNLSPQYLFHRRAIQRSKKILRLHLFHLLSQCSTASTSGEDIVAFMSLGSWQGMWCVLVTWKTTDVVIGIKMPPFCPGPSATPSREVVELVCSTSCYLTVPSLQPTVHGESGTWISYQEMVQILVVSSQHSTWFPWFYAQDLK